jgi:hypothetical protein
MNARWIGIKRTAALLGGVLGLAVGILISAFRFGWVTLQPGVEGQPVTPTGVGLLDGLAFLLVFTLPFALSLAALYLDRPPAQAAIWLGVALLAFFGSWATFSALTLFTMPIPALLLGGAGLIALMQSGPRRVLPALGVGVVLVVVGAAAFLTLFTRDDPACWALIQAESGEPVWEPRPFSQSSPAIPANPGPGDPISWTCTTDVISASESLVSMSLWGLALLTLAAIWPRLGMSPAGES